ncbi:MAG: hypothetical protein DPW16_20770 [Chloroflexi bacterium]|nr:hypothetical protein [Chloroflexota bacterium]
MGIAVAVGVHVGGKVGVGRGVFVGIGEGVAVGSMDSATTLTAICWKVVSEKRSNISGLAAPKKKIQSLSLTTNNRPRTVISSLLVISSNAG